MKLPCLRNNHAEEWLRLVFHIEEFFLIADVLLIE
jgi:hypothetical protein